MVISGHVLRAALLVGVAVVFCAGTASAAETETGAAAWACPDSAAVAGFHGLPQDAQEARAQQAAALAESALEAESAPVIIAGLREAVTLNPTDTGHLLALAEICRASGYRVEAYAALDAARGQFRALKGQERRDAIRDYALIRGWMEYADGNWADGEALGAKAVEAGAGTEGHLVELLNMAARPMQLTEISTHMVVFAPYENDTGNRRSDWGWCRRAWAFLHRVSFEQEMYENCERRQTRLPRNNVLRWRDYGMACEREGRGDWAECYYRRSREAVRAADGGWITGHARETAGAADLRMGPMPFWTNPDGGYVTGSLFAYAAYAWEMMDAAPDEDVAVWAERLMAVAASCQHRYPDRPWVRLWRGAAFLALGDLQEAYGEFGLARDDFDRLGLDEPRLDPLQGRVMLHYRKYDRARPLLERGVQTQPRNARCWADLGTLHATLGEDAEALAAFDMAVGLDPRMAVAWYNRGILRAKDGQWQAALDDLKVAADLAPQDRKVITDLQQVQRKLQADRRAAAAKE